VNLVGALAVGLAGGVLAGMLGIGGGILFVPALSLMLGKTQVQAEATSLLAIVPVAAVGSWRQAAHGNVRVADAILIGLLSPLGVAAGAVVANTLPQRVLEVVFSILILFVAANLAANGLRRRPASTGERPPLGARTPGTG
jgi:uncharacterized protein